MNLYIFQSDEPEIEFGDTNDGSNENPTTLDPTTPISLNIARTPVGTGSHGRRGGRGGSSSRGARHKFRYSKKHLGINSSSNKEASCHKFNESSLADDKKLIKLPEADFKVLEDYPIKEAPPMPNSYIRYMERPIEEIAEEVEYDLDEEDCAWLDLVNEKREGSRSAAITPEVMEFLMDRLEKESYFQVSDV